ncbi:phosphoadenosine phosphosulfate reductase family protein [Sphingomonas sp. 10B4]|uniref:phosphoadenosine phosphosulfate reductase domain-containing protein n=1 Tax=Sphingomonas sp. 10B4 TaxID=3048575 RepID=UPI002AB458D8|nr:phosphoadenosine phosphosulfate reductase family protein [Sphingomonas sp. 10B4]MDY7525530.1 phosphoadenosine phosphosulfate reductase family protein [Sphingomonas sp. 10B4]MEB0281476.1 phosphoadenosine phosphosulfate reductase family protein [Sphingomonas sp. 10B4]
MSASPYLITGPALISFSGGRTSAYMLKQMLDAAGGAFAPDVHVVFANTGKEREETLRFVHECQVRWGVPIHWIEWRSRLKRTPVAERFEEVGYNSAARAGQPFEALIASKKTTPNAARRFCTEHLKMQILADFMEDRGYATWTNVVGLRADEMHRAAKKDAQNDEANRAWQSVMPLVRARVTKRVVLRYWLGDSMILGHEEPQGFDLGLEGWQGNCDMCFLKGRGILEHTIRVEPERADWWSRIERTIGRGRFVTEWSVADLARDVARSPVFTPFDPDAEYDAECGVGGADVSIRCGRKAA